MKTRMKPKGKKPTGSKLLKMDPSRTGDIRKAFELEVTKRLNRVKNRIMIDLVKQDALGLTTNVFCPKEVPTTNADWSALPQNDQVKSFEQYLLGVFADEMIGKQAESVWEMFIMQALTRGAKRAFDDYMQMKQPASMKPEAWKMGVKNQFLQSAFTHPIAKEKIQLIVSRPLRELKGMTDASTQQMTRALADGLARGDSPRTIGRSIAKVIDGMSNQRATTIARTEVIRAHAEGQLIALTQLGVKKLDVDVEWSTTGDGKVCPHCKSLQGKVVPIEKASGMLPRHPQCRCAWKPYVPLPEGFKRVNGKIVEDKEPQLTANVDANGNPLDVVSAWMLVNAFCPTGHGGGVDPSCGGIKLPPPPTFVSSNKAAVAENNKAIGEMRFHAAKGDAASVAAHPGTPSPKVQQHKQDLLTAISKATGTKTTTTHNPPPPTPPSSQEIPVAKGGSVGVVKDHVAKATGYTYEQLKAGLSSPANPKNVQAAVIRANVTGAIYTGGHGIKDAALHVIAGDNSATKAELIKGMTTGNPEKALKEYRDTPIYDLHVLSGITQSNHALPGQAVCYMGTRVVEMGTTSVTGDYRHELGHAIRSALGGESHNSQTVITKAIHDDYTKVKEKVAADPQGMKMKLSHDEYETKYGVVGRRSLDNWEEHFAEHYRLYHREIYRDTKEGGNGKYLAQYRERHPTWANIWDAHYTAALIGQQGNLTANAFCPTGKGGGVDPTCSPGGKGDWSVPMYHATASWNVDSIKKEGFRVNNGTFGTGVYLSLGGNKKAATGTNTKDAAVLTVRAKVKNPLHLDLRHGDDKDWEKQDDYNTWTKLHGDGGEEGRQRLLAAGYDAVSIKFGMTEYRLVLDPSLLTIEDTTKQKGGE